MSRRHTSTCERQATAAQSSLAADKIAERRNRAASPRNHADGCVDGIRSEDIAPTWQG